MNCKFLFLMLAALPPALMAAPDAAVALRSGPQPTALVELFTSEGCSSCPPADQWLGAFVGQPALWRDFVPVVWHVDYWDGLGWPDRFATKANTQRQENYAAGWRTPGLYTPGFVFNGAEWRGWNRGLHFPWEVAKASVGVLEMAGGGTNQIRVTFTPVAGRAGAFDATVVWLGSDLLSAVGRGENAGRKLRHNFVALHTATVKLKPVGGAFAATVPLPRPTGPEAARLALAGWVSHHGEMAPVQAVGGWWSE